MTRIVSMLLLSAATLSMAPALPGTWTITGDVQGYPINDVCVFTQADDKLSGSCTMEGKTLDATAISTDGGKLVWAHGGEYEGQPLTLTYTGAFTEKGDITGTIYVTPLAVDGTFSAKKGDAKPAPAQ
jgi:hypothetical protein